MLVNSAGWSSLEARRAHNPKVIGSNPIPATKKGSITLVVLPFFYYKTLSFSMFLDYIPKTMIFYILLGFYFTFVLLQIMIHVYCIPANDSLYCKIYRIVSWKLHKTHAIMSAGGMQVWKK